MAAVPERGSVVVLGADMAGLAAGLEPSRQGAEPLVVARAPAPGGSMALSGGLMWVPRNLLQAPRARR